MPEDGLAGLVDPEGRRNLMVATLSHGNKNKLQRGLRRCPRDRGHVARHTKAAHTASRQQLFETSAESGNNQPPVTSTR